MMQSPINKRQSIGALALSAVALVGIALNEGYSDKAITPVPGDVPTIGFGTTQGVKIGDKITPPKALARALADVQKYEGAVKKCVTVPLTQNEYDAYIDLAYNIGTAAFCGSTAVKRLNAYDYTGACEAILLFKKFQGRDCSLLENKHLCGGIWTRRQAAHQQCTGAAPVRATGVTPGARLLRSR